MTDRDGRLRYSLGVRGPVHVTDGTGEYAGVSGTGTVQFKANNTTVFTLHLN